MSCNVVVVVVVVVVVLVVVVVETLIWEIAPAESNLVIVLDRNWLNALGRIGLACLDKSVVESAPEIGLVVVAGIEQGLHPVVAVVAAILSPFL
jgi:steroid 5-alpha reductase family enzyme